MSGEYKPDIGRTPMAAAEPTLQRVNQERGYEMRPEVRRHSYVWAACLQALQAVCLRKCASTWPPKFNHMLCGEVEGWVEDD